MAKKPRYCKLCDRKSFSVRLRKIDGGERKAHYVCKKCVDQIDKLSSLKGGVPSGLFTKRTLTGKIKEALSLLETKIKLGNLNE